MMQKRGFTLIELLVVLAMVAALAALLFPGLSRSRERARQASCTSNMRQVGNAIAIYSGDWDDQYPGVGSDIDTTVGAPDPSSSSGASTAESSAEYGAQPQSEISPVGPQPLNGMWTGPKWHDALRGYLGSTEVYRCPSDPSDPYVTDAAGHPALDDRGRPLGVPSYLLNGWFIDTMDGEKKTVSSLKRPAQTIELVEGNRDYVCTIISCVDDEFHPWEPLTNWAPTLAVLRHGRLSNYLFADGHVQSLFFEHTIWPISATGSWPSRSVTLDLYNLE